MWQAGLLVSVDMVTNITDYGFHVYLGRALSPGEFAVVQTMNAVLLILVTAFAVMQPVVARYVAASGAESSKIEASDQVGGQQAAIFQAYFWQSVIIGLVLFLFVIAARAPLASWLNVPLAAVVVAAPMMLLTLARPVVSGMLQGQERFVGLGLTRTVYALGRFAIVLLLIGLLGGGAIAAVLALPLGALLALAVGLALLGGAVWQRGLKLPRALVWQGWRLSLAALLAYTAYMALLNGDLIWVNRTFDPELAGSYATAVVFRRVLAVLPAAILVILYPRVVARIARGQLPDSLLLKSAAVIASTGAVITLLYYIFGPWLVELTFGSGYAPAGPLLGLMGLAMIGFGLTAIWLNLYLATRPWPFVGLLVIVAILQVAIFVIGQETLQAMTVLFNLGGWLCALGGLALYLAWLRPSLAHR